MKDLKTESERTERIYWSLFGISHKFVRGQIDDKRDISQKRFVRKFIQKRAVQNPLAPRLRRVAERRLHGSAGGWNGTQMWSGFAEVGVDEGDLFGGEEALGLLVAGGEEGLMELLAIGHHLHEVAHGITGVALREIGESEFGLGKHGIQ